MVCVCVCVCLFVCLFVYKRTPLNQDAGYPDRLGPSGKFDENSTQLTCLEIALTDHVQRSVLASRTSYQA